MRPCIHPVVLSQVLIDHRGWGWLARQEVAEISGPVVSFLSVSHHRTGLIA